MNVTLLSSQLEPCYILRPLGYYLICIWIIGTSLNGSILYAFIRNEKLRQSSTNIFIGGLVLADFFAACFEIPLPAISLLNCRWIFTYVGCVIEAFIAYFAGCSNMYILCLISIDRYIVVIKPFSSTNITIKQTYIAIGCAYLLSLFWTLMPIFGWSSYDYEGTGASCSIKWEDRSFSVVSYNITITVFVYFVPVIIMLVTNIKIHVTIYRRRQCTNVNLNKSNVRRQFLIERRITHTVILIIGGFLLAWTPYTIAVIVQLFSSKNSFPPILGTLPAIFAKTSVVWNPFIYIVRNGNFHLNLPFYTEVNLEQERNISDQIRHSTYPCKAVHLPLTSRSAICEL